MSKEYPVEFIVQARLIVDSFRRAVGRDLIPASSDDLENARRLFHAPLVVVSHGTQEDPILNYANRVALDLWEFSIPELLTTPSRLTAEPMHRDERARLLERTSRDGYVDDYQGIRISRTGRRFRIHRALVWNLVDAEEKRAGQAAAFAEFQFLPENQ